MARVPHQIAADEIHASIARTKTALRDTLHKRMTMRNEMFLVGGTLMIASVVLFRAAYLMDGDESRFYFRAGMLTVFAALIVCWVISLAHAIRRWRQETSSIINELRSEVEFQRARGDGAERQRNDNSARIKKLEGLLQCRELVRNMWGGDVQATQKLGELLRGSDNWEN